MRSRARVIESNKEYLRKLFIMPDKPDKFIEFGHQLLEMIHEFFSEKGGIHSSISLLQLSEIFAQTDLPGEPHLIKDVLAEIKNKVTAHSVKVCNPHYIGHMTSAIPYFMILLEMIIASLNQNQVKIETAKASSFVERELVAWFHNLVYQRGERFYNRNVQNPRVALGNVTADGTIGNLTALLIARERAFPPDGAFSGCRHAGMAEAMRHYGYERAVILVSTRGHYSIKKSASILGLGEENVISVPVDRCNRIDMRSLNRRISQLDVRSGRTKIIALVGIGGTTETGNVDKLQKLGDLAEELGAYFHVDACWGGTALIVDEFRPLFKGIEMADSVTVDAHKLLYCPMTMGMVLFRNERDLNAIRQSSNYVIRRNSVDMGRFTLEGSRPFSSLKPWAALKIIGREGYRILLTGAKQNTEDLQEILATNGNFENLNTPELFILNYRFNPRPVRERLNDWWALRKSEKDRKTVREIEKDIQKLNQLINALNIKLHKALRRDDTTFVSRTTLESTRYRPQKIVVLRAIPINPLTDRGILEEIVETQNRLGLELWPEFEPAFERLVEGCASSNRRKITVPGASHGRT